MKLTNKSKWDTRDLRKIVLKCIRIEGCRKDLIVKMSTLRKDTEGYVRGEAQFNGRLIRIRLKAPSEIRYRPAYHHVAYMGELLLRSLKTELAQVILHEIQHIRGNEHRDMIESWDLKVDWVLEFELRPKKETSKPERNLREERYQNVLQLIKKNKTRLRRTKTILEKLHRKKKYYEKGGIRNGEV